MFSSSTIPTSLKIEKPETIWLDLSEPLASFGEADNLSPKQSDAREGQQWKRYLNQLALAGFEQWLQPRVPSHWIDKTQCVNRPEAVYNLRLNGFTISLLVKEHVLDEVVDIPEAAIRQAELTAHFYVLIEVAEEQQMVIVRGFLRHETLNETLNQRQLNQQDNHYCMPLFDFDLAPDHLIFYCNFLAPTAAPSQILSAETSEVQSVEARDTIPRIRIGQWLEGIFAAGWESVETIADTLIGSEARLAMGTRGENGDAVDCARRGKLLDLGLDLEGQSVALLVNVTQAMEGKRSVLVQLHPSGEAQYLPSGIVLTLLSQSNTKLQEVQARAQDNYIQLKPFKGLPGVLFNITISLGEAFLCEKFEL